MTTGPDFAQWCLGQVGTTELPPGSNLTPYASEADLTDGLSWCHTFLVAGARETGLALPSGVAVAGTIYAYEHWQAAGRAGTTPRPYAWGYIHFPEDPPGINHVELLLAPNPNGSWKCVGGNTNFPGLPSSRSNGGAVAVNDRPAWFFVGFGYPDYAIAPTPAPTPGGPLVDFVAPVLWMAPNPNGTRPYFVVGPGQTDHDFVVASVDNAPFTPAWVDGFVAPPSQPFQYEDFSWLGLYWRRVKQTTGAMQGPMAFPTAVVVACSGGGTYAVAEQ